MKYELHKIFFVKENQVFTKRQEGWDNDTIYLYNNYYLCVYIDDSISIEYQ